MHIENNKDAGGTMQRKTEEQITLSIEKCVAAVIQKKQQALDLKPFHEALLTKPLIIASSFERSFSSSFGKNTIEEISRLIAAETSGEVVPQKQTIVNITQSSVDEIGRILRLLREGSVTPNWQKEQDRVIASNKGPYITHNVKSDLWLKRGSKEIFCSIKTVKPNLDQCEIAKKDMLMLKAHDPKYETYICFYYNPSGLQKQDYSWSFTKRMFDTAKDDCVLIGPDYWDFLGGPGTYINLLKIFEKVGVNEGTIKRYNVNQTNTSCFWWDLTKFSIQLTSSVFLYLEYGNPG